jgi:hypothetical protein
MNKTVDFTNRKNTLDCEFEDISNCDTTKGTQYTQDYWIKEKYKDAIDYRQLLLELVLPLLIVVLYFLGAKYFIFG